MNDIEFPEGFDPATYRRMQANDPLIRGIHIDAEKVVEQERMRDFADQYDETPYRRAFREYQRKLDDAVLRNIYSALSDDERGERVMFYDLDNPLIAASEQDGVYKITSL